MAKKSIMLHNNDLIIELIGELNEFDVSSVVKKIKYLSRIYSVEHIIINLKKLENKENYIDIFDSENIILIY